MIAAKPEFSLRLHEKAVRMISMLAVVVGGLVLFGWVFDLALLKSVISGGNTMKVNTAICFVFSGLALNLSVMPLAANNNFRYQSYAKVACASIVLFIGLATLGEHLWDRNFGIDELIWKGERNARAPIPGRMSLMTALNFTLLGIGLLSGITQWRYALCITECAAIGMLGISSVALLGYMYYLEALYNLPVYSTMAIHTALLFELLALGLLLVNATFTKTAWRYGMAVLTVALGLSLHLILNAWVGPGLLPFITFYPVVMTVALWGGFGPGLFTTALSASVTIIWLFEPIGKFAIQSGIEKVSVAFFCGMGLFISAALRLYHLHRKKAEVYEREKAVYQSRREVEFLGNILETASQPFAVGYPDGRLGLINAAYEALTGYKAEELRQLDWLTALTPMEWREKEQENLNKLQRTGEPVRYEKEYLRKDGTRIPVELLTHRVCDAAGRLDYFYAFVTDISERKQAEAALRESEERYRSLFDGSLDAIFSLGSDGKFNTANNAALRLSGKTQEEIQSLHFLDLCAPDQRENAASAFRAAFCRQCLTLDTALISSNGVRRDIFISGAPTIIDGEVVGVSCIARDMTERKRAERALRESEYRFRQVTESLPQLIWTSRADGSCDYLGPQWCNYTGIPEQPQLGFGWLAQVYPADRERVASAWQMTTTEDNDFVIDFRIRRFDGVYRWFHARAVPLRDGAGVIVKWFGSNTDIEDHKQAREALLESEERLRLFVEYAPVAVAMFDTGMHYLAVSQQWLNDYQLGTGVLGRCHYDVFPNMPEHWKAAHRRGLAGEIVVSESDSYNRVDGSVQWVRWEVRPWYTTGGAVGGIMILIQDITGQKQYEAELTRYKNHLEQLVEERTRDLEQARQEALHLAKVKSSFLATMSHEIRSPMNGMLGFFYLLEQRPLDSEAKELLRKARFSGEALVAIINDILDFSKIESGQFDVQQNPFRLSDVLDHIAALMTANSADKNLELIINPCPTFADYLIGDAFRLQQVLVNLTSNAIKFTEKGEVELAIKVVGDLHEDSIKLRFLIRDTGIGIPTEKQQAIFTAFTQADNSIARRFGGSGLGLAISRQLVELMGGRLQVDSVEGKGSTFWFELTFERNLGAYLPRTEHKHLEVLIADDSETASSALSNTAHTLGWVAETVASGEAAYINVLQRAKMAKPYDVILMDWQMPQMDGLAAAKAIKKITLMGSQQPMYTPLIIMVTAFSREQLLTQPGIECVDLVLNKPVTPTSLLNAVMSVIAKRDHAAELAKMPEDKNSQLAGLTILVVDDSDINREIAHDILSLHGALVQVAENGQDALDWLETHPGEVDLVLMDVQMPEMDGYEATRRIKQNPEFSGLPVAALTAGAFSDDQEQAKAAGMDGFIAKPFNVDQLISVIQRLARSRTGRANLLADGSSTISNAEIDVEATVLAVIDFEEGFHRFSDRANFVNYLNKFMGAYANVGTEILTLAEKGEINEASALAHKLKGTAANLALKQVSHYAAVLESSLSSGRDVNRYCQDLQAAIEDAGREIKRFS